jgi:hypothetical protein
MNGKRTQAEIYNEISDIINDLKSAPARGLRIQADPYMWQYNPESKIFKAEYPGILVAVGNRTKAVAVFGDTLNQVIRVIDGLDEELNHVKYATLSVEEFARDNKLSVDAVAEALRHLRYIDDVYTTVGTFRIWPEDEDEIHYVIEKLRGKK